MRVSYDSKKISVAKGIFLVKTATLPIKSVVRVTTRRSLLLRLFHAREVELFCNFGSIKLFLGRNESFPFVGEFPLCDKRSKLSEEILSAFLDTRATGGVFLFVTALLRSGRLLGEEYAGKLATLLRNIISDTADNVANVLSSLQIIIPRAVVGVAVFVFSAWSFAFVRKLLKLMHFRSATTKECVWVKSGVFTLYEHILFRNTNIPVLEASVLSLLSHRTVARMRGVIVKPSVTVERAGKSHCFRGFWGHCGVSISTALISGVLAVVSGIYSAEILETLLYCVFAGAVYSSFVCAFFMLWSELSEEKRGVFITSRKSQHLYFVSIPHERIVCSTFRRNLFNKFRGNVEIFTHERLKFKVRQISDITAVLLSEPQQALSQFRMREERQSRYD